MLLISKQHSKHSNSGGTKRDIFVRRKIIEVLGTGGEE
jgi:hypothetical protein